jgi:hypothetical protein
MAAAAIAKAIGQSLIRKLACERPIKWMNGLVVGTFQIHMMPIPLHMMSVSGRFPLILGILIRVENWMYENNVIFMKKVVYKRHKIW